MTIRERFLADVSASPIGEVMDEIQAIHAAHAEWLVQRAAQPTQTDERQARLDRAMLLADMREDL